VTVGDGRTTDQFVSFGRDRLAQFGQELSSLKRERRRAVRTAELWTEDRR